MGRVLFISPEAEFATQRDVDRVKRDIRTFGIKVAVRIRIRRVHPGMTGLCDTAGIRSAPERASPFPGAPAATDDAAGPPARPVLSPKSARPTATRPLFGARSSLSVRTSQETEATLPPETTGPSTDGHDDPVRDSNGSGRRLPENEGHGPDRPSLPFGAEDERTRARGAAPRCVDRERDRGALGQYRPRERQRGGDRQARGDGARRGPLPSELEGPERPTSSPSPEPEPESLEAARPTRSSPELNRESPEPARPTPSPSPEPNRESPEPARPTRSDSRPEPAGLGPALHPAHGPPLGQQRQLPLLRRAHARTARRPNCRSCGSRGSLESTAGRRNHQRGAGLRG